VEERGDQLWGWLAGYAGGETKRKDRKGEGIGKWGERGEAARNEEKEKGIGKWGVNQK
jgi:hypothetical protein